MALSDKQRKIIEFIADFVSQHPYPPGVRQIQDGCDISSTSVVAYHLHLLENEGYIGRDKEISRGIRLLKGVDGQPFITPKTLRVFLCYASADKPAIRDLHRHLCDEGIDAWLDEEKLLPGQDWQREIPKAVRDSDVVIVCLSCSSINKAGYVQKEIKFALDVADEQPEGTIFLIPARLEECDVPERLRRWQWVNLYEPKGYERLMRALRARADALKTQPPPQPAQVAHKPPQPDLAGLRQKLAEHFNREELRTLCFDLDIQHENLPDTLDGMARELVAHCQRDGRIPELVAACQRLRPRVEWGIPTTTQKHSDSIASVYTLGAKRKFGGIEFVRVPAGKFVMGSKDDNALAYDYEKPQHTVELPYDYWLACFPVTNDQFARFIEATQYPTTAEKEGGWSGKEYVKGFDWRHPLGPESDLKDKGEHPVVQVSWYDATEYAKWLKQQLKAEIGDGEIRLPTEAEWEKAARGEYGNEWPWGNEFDATKCNSFEGGKGGTTPAGAYSPQGDSPYGAADMVGNVWEWTASLWGKDPGKPDYEYPYKPNDGRENLNAGGDVFRVVRGGSFLFYQWYTRAAARGRYPPVDRARARGFRVVVAPRLS